jgi:C4-dicarboxylate-specific signal transduction histidine kinase
MKGLNRAFWTRVFLMTVAALVPLLLVAALDRRGNDDLKELARRTARELDRLIQLRQQQVFAIGAFPSIRAFTSTSPESRSQRAAVALNELQAWVAADTNVREAFLVDENGIVIMTTLEDWNEDVSARRFIQEALAGQIAVSPVAQDRGEFSNYYASPVLNNEKNIAGALVIRVAAQELWSVTPSGKSWYAVIIDENGVRLDDAGDPARRLQSFAPLDAGRAAAIVQEQTYGAQLPQLRATNLTRAQELLSQGALDQLTPADFDGSAIGAQRLVSKPWYVLVIGKGPTPVEGLARFGIPALAAILLTLGGAALMGKMKEEGSRMDNGQWTMDKR